MNSLKLSEVLTKDELRELSKKSDIKALSSLVWTWALIAGAFAIAIVWTNPLTILFGVVLLGGRQLALGVINHDCAHHAFFNDAYPEVYNAEAARDAWGKTLTFFGAHLR